MTKTVQDKIHDSIAQHAILLFMKGTPTFPQCGFSAKAVSILEHMGVGFETIDVLRDEELRQKIKEYSDWPTVPQLYVKGEFVGGCDIMNEMYTTGELKQLLRNKELL